MKKPHWLALAALAASAVFLSFLAGRATAPEKIRETSVESMRSRSESAELTASVAESFAATKEIVKWRTRVVVKPDGTRIETRDASRGAERSEGKREAVVKTVTVVEERERLVYHDRETSRVRPNWSTGVSFGYGLDLRPRYQAEFARRLVGGLWLTAGIDVSGRAALAGLRMEF